MNNRREINAASLSLPKQLDLEGALFYESSGMSGAQTLYVDGLGGAYLKIAPAGSLKNAALMQAYLHKLGLSSEVLAYQSLDRDYLLTAPLPGEDGTTNRYLSNPEQLSRLFGESLSLLHQSDADDCPVVDRMDAYLKEAKKSRFEQKHLDLLSDYIGEANADEAGEEIARCHQLITNDTLIHGDYCLPNILISKWALSGFIDVADSGLGDPHYDLVWGLWTLAYNLKTPDYGKIFLDAYGRKKVDKARLRICGLLSAMT